jgi:lipopolysaccharide transport system ATP-binding protein
MKPAIRVENLSKQYRIGTGKWDSTRNLTEVFVDGTKGVWRALTGRGRGGDGVDTLWALKDVSFEVQPGEVVGIIGRNGAGKSTLLKILSRIVEPTSGRAVVRGRMGSLLEVGTGFHPELTGRENIYLNGSVLGMSRKEIDQKFDEIVAFSEIERFLDTPVKRFSSGMYVRLAFAVAAHLNPEILFIDEVLAVGDANFQQRCLGKIEQVSRTGRTVLFISHNMAAVQRLCRRAILLSNGRLQEDGDCSSVAHRYFAKSTTCGSERRWVEDDKAGGDGSARLRSVRVLDRWGEVATTHNISDPVYIEVEYDALEPGRKVTAIVHVLNEQGVCLFASNDFSNPTWWKTPRRAGRVRCTCMIPGDFMAEGTFYVLVALGSYNPNVVHALEGDAVYFQIVDNTKGEGVRGCHVGDWPGVVRPRLQWKVETDSHFGVL